MILMIFLFLFMVSLLPMLVGRGLLPRGCFLVSWGSGWGSWVVVSGGGLAPRPGFPAGVLTRPVPTVESSTVTNEVSSGRVPVSNVGSNSLLVDSGGSGSLGNGGIGP